MAERSLCGDAVEDPVRDVQFKDDCSSVGVSANVSDDPMETIQCSRDSFIQEVACYGSEVKMETDSTSQPVTATDLSTFDSWCCSFQPEQQRSRPKSIPPPLTLHNANDPLTEFAIIATSPRSPLMQKNLPIRKRVYSWGADSIHSYAKQPPTPPLGILSPPPSQPSISPFTGSFEDSEAVVPSTSPSLGSPFASTGDQSNGSSPNDSNSREGWPNPVWHCFFEGTSVRFVDDWPTAHFNHRSASWYLAEELRLSYAEHGLRLVKIVENSGTLHLQFRPVVCECSSCSTNGSLVPEPDIEVECALDHPFYTTVGGWASGCPEMTANRYGIRCRHLQINDICRPRSETSSPLLFDFTPEDTSAALTLSGMAKHRQEQIQNHIIMSPPASPTKECLDEIQKKTSKRPMNAFMLFAKDYRKELKAQHPDKDNRAISVLLGEAWKSMPEEKRDAYAQTSRILAEAKKKLDPDCWKRRQSLSKSL